MKKKIIVLAPHPDDGEFGCGATIKKLSDEKKNELFYVAFSRCEKSLPKDAAKDILFKEMEKAIDHLGILKDHIITFDFPVRDFPPFRQEILEELIKLKKNIQPDLVFTPNSIDIHQDHHVIFEEAKRAFKQSSILGYELIWNDFISVNNYFQIVSENQLLAKTNAIAEYKTQKTREYNSAEKIKSLARVRGMQVNTEFAEGFEVIRWIEK